MFAAPEQLINVDILFQIVSKEGNHVSTSHETQCIPVINQKCVCHANGHTYLFVAVCA